MIGEAQTTPVPDDQNPLKTDYWVRLVSPTTDKPAGTAIKPIPTELRRPEALGGADVREFCRIVARIGEDVPVSGTIALEDIVSRGLVPLTERRGEHVKILVRP